MRRGRRGSWLASVAAMAVIAGCGPSTTPTPSAPPDESAAGMAEDCPAIDLRTPGGERIDLNGTWATELEGTRSGIYFFRQVGTCVWFSGGYPGVPSQRRRGVEGDLGPLDLVTVVFFGHIRSDFTITGEWVDVREQFHPTSSLPRGTIRLNIEVDGPNAVRLVYAGGEGQPFIEPGIRENQSWVKVADQGAYPVPD